MKNLSSLPEYKSLFLMAIKLKIAWMNQFIWRHRKKRKRNWKFQFKKMKTGKVKIWFCHIYKIRDELEVQIGSRLFHLGMGMFLFFGYTNSFAQQRPGGGGGGGGEERRIRWAIGNQLNDWWTFKSWTALPTSIWMPSQNEELHNSNYIIIII